MQIVIDIPECFYEYCKAQEDAVEVQLAIKNGTPLPKNHGRLIDASQLYTVTSYDADDNHEICYVPYEDIENAPTILDAEVENVRSME